MKEIISLGVKGGIWDLDLLFSSGWHWASYFSSAASVNRGHWSKCFQKSLYYDLHWRHIKISHHSPGQELTMSVHRQLHQIENSTTPAPHTLSSPWPTVQDTLNVLRLPQAPGRPHSPVRSHSLAHVTFSPRQNSSFPGPLPIIPQPSALLRPPPWDLRPPQPIFTFSRLETVTIFYFFFYIRLCKLMANSLREENHVSAFHWVFNVIYYTKLGVWKIFPCKCV